MEQSAGRLRQSTIPLYRQILEGIKQKIEAGELKAGDRLPSEQELMEHYQVSRRTVRTAVDELCDVCLEAEASPQNCERVEFSGRL